MELDPTYRRVPSKGAWCGKPLEEMTKEELIDALVRLNDLYLKAVHSSLNSILNLPG